MTKRFSRVLGLLLLFAAVQPALLRAQQRNAVTAYSVTGRIIVPIASFQDLFEVLLVENLEQLVQATVADNQGRYRFTSLTRGTYYIVVKLEGFEDVRQRVDVGTSADNIVNIILDFKEERVVQPPVDFSGEVGEVVDIGELKKKYPSRILDEYSEAEEDVRKGNYFKAQPRLEALVREAPDFYDAHKLLGATYQRQGRYRDAEGEYRTASELRPASAAPLVNLGSLYIQEADASTNQGNAAVRKILNQALGSLDSALKLRPDAAFAYYLLGVTYYKSAFYEDAEDNLKRALFLESRLSHARLALANVYVKIQEWSNAIEQLTAYLTENPRSADRAEVEAMRAKISRRSQAQVR